MTAPSITSITFDKTAYNKGDAITCTVKYADSNTHGVVNGQGMFTAVGSLQQGASLTPSITTTKVGDFILYHVITEGSAPPTGISGGNCTWQQIGTTFTGTVNTGFSAAVYLGTVTAVGTAVATITASGVPTATRTSGQEYHSSTGQIVFVTQANLDVTGSNTGPNINPTAANQLYSFYGFSSSTTTAGSTPGYTYEIDNNGNAYVFNTSMPQPSVAPVVGNSTLTFGIAVLMYASLSAGTFTAIGGLIQSLTNTVSVNPQNLGDFVILHVFTIGNAPASGITGGNCNWQQVGTTFPGTIQAGFAASVWVGTAIATGAANAVVAFSGTPTSVIIEGQEYYSSTGTIQFIAQAGLDSAGTKQMPTLNPTAPGQLYACAALDSVTSTAGTDPGYTYYTDSNGNGYLFNPSCTSNPQSPQFGDSTHGFGLSVLFSSGTSNPSGPPTPAASPLIVSIAAQAGTDAFGNPFPQGLGVEKGNISGTTLSAGNTLQVDQNGLAVYNGAPVPANLQLFISPTGGIVTKSPIILNQSGGTPIANPNQGATEFSGHGDIQVVDGLDQQAYATQRRSIATGGDQTINSTTFASFGLTSNVAADGSAREYRIHAQMFCAPNQTGGKIGFRWIGPGATTGHINFTYKSPAASPATSNDESGALNNGVSTTGAITATMASGFETDVTADGTIQVPAGVSGQFAIQAAEGTAGDSFIIRQFSYLDIMTV